MVTDLITSKWHLWMWDPLLSRRKFTSMTWRGRDRDGSAAPWLCLAPFQGLGWGSKWMTSKVLCTMNLGFSQRVWNITTTLLWLKTENNMLINTTEYTVIFFPLLLTPQISGLTQYLSQHLHSGDILQTHQCPWKHELVVLLWSLGPWPCLHGTGCSTVLPSLELLSCKLECPADQFLSFPYIPLLIV